MTDVFADIKVGDLVCRRNRYDRSYLFFEVSKVMPSRFQTADGATWRKSDGREIGGTGLKRYVSTVDDEVSAEVRRRQRIDSAKRDLRAAADRLRSADGEEAIRLAALLPDDLKEPPK